MNEEWTMSNIERWTMSECPDCGVLTCATADQVQWCDEHCRSNPTVVEVVRADSHAGVVATLERIRDHANSGDDPALLAQHELDRIQRKSPA